ncbi:nucleoside-diphosphate kinase [Bacillus altitudinis]|uniref:nucleoside-diphosphate kinase n=1 Tax=Bacillus altitudinis TaxID=293387 RepID=UPI003B522F75
MLSQPQQLVHLTTQIIPNTNPNQPLPPTITPHYRLTLPKNIIHPSHSPQSPQTQINLFFKQQQLTNSNQTISSCIY